METSSFQTPYAGNKRRLVISLDIGTTFSGASYMILTPGQAPEKFSVTGFKGQEHHMNSSKVPTVLLYDNNGNLMKCGAEAIKEYDKHGLGIEVEWFKLLLAPRKLFETSLRHRPKVNTPAGLTVIDVLGDYLGFLNDCVRKAIIQTQPEGEEIWESLAVKAQYILSHPNGWEGAQQNMFREAAIKGGLISNHATDGDRIQFVTEGEASFHWCVSSQTARDMLKIGSVVVIADAGGGTIDVSSFRVTSLKPLEVEEVHTPTCELAGSVFVTQTFAKQIQDHLKYSDFGDEENIDQIVNVFESNTKCLFDDPDNPAFIKFGRRGENDAEYGIRNGVLAVPGDLVAAAFRPSYSAITSAVRKHVRPNTPDSYIFLVGGFAASPFLYEKVKDELRELGIPVKRNDSHTSKAVAEGGLSFHLERHVAKRIAKYTLGIEVERVFSPTTASHMWRVFQRQTCPISGTTFLPGGFLPLVTKGGVISEGEEYRDSVYLTVTDKKAIRITKSIIKYTGAKKDIEFFDMDDQELFEHLCTFTADHIPSEALKEISSRSGRHYEFPCDVVITLGGTEVKCYIEWDESGERTRSFATPVWMDAEQTVESD